MSVSGKEAEGLTRPADAEEIERLYAQLSEFLLGVLTEKYKLTLADSELLLEDSFGAFVSNKASVVDAQGWLFTEVCKEAEMLQLIRAFERALQEPSRGARDLELIRTALATLPENAREVVRLRFFERKSYEDIAAMLDVPVSYLQTVVGKSVATVSTLRRRFRRRE